MDWNGIGTFALFFSTGAMGVGLIILAGFRMKLKHRLDLQRLQGGSGEGPAEEVEQLREEMHDLLEQQSAQIAELQERLDFTERLLTKGKG